MRRFLTLILIGTGLLAAAAPGFGQDDAPGPVVVADVRGPLEARALDFLVAAVRSPDAQVVVLQLDNPGLASGEPAELLAAIQEADTPIAAWVGPSGAAAFGLAGQLLDAADVAGAAQGAHFGYLQQPRAGGPIVTGTPWDDTPYGLGEVTVDSSSASMELIDVVTPTIGQFIVSLDGLVVGNLELETAETITADDGAEVTVPSVFVRFEKPSLTTRFLRLGMRPDAAFFFLLAGLALVAFEFYAAGVGVTAAVAAVSLLLAGFGLASLPMNWIAVGAAVLGLGAYNWDFQRNELGVRSIAGTGLLLYGGLAFTDAGPQFGPRWWVVLVVVAGIGLFYMFAMTTIVRSRYSTPTIGREYLVGQRGTATSTFDPEGIIDLDGARWRARTTRAADVAPGDALEVLEVNGIVLEVGPVDSE
jgi:membrane-bound serine protease (ClpP class)